MEKHFYFWINIPQNGFIGLLVILNTSDGKQGMFTKQRSTRNKTSYRIPILNYERDKIETITGIKAELLITDRSLLNTSSRTVVLGITVLLNHLDSDTLR